MIFLTESALLRYYPHRATRRKRPAIIMDLRAQMVQFGELVVRDYLRSKGLEKTISVFDEELQASRTAPPSVDAW